MISAAVLDASAALNLVLGTESAGAIAKRLEKCHSVMAPDLFPSEVGNGLWKYVRIEVLSVEVALTRLEEAMSLVETIIPASSLCAEALVAAARYGHSVYDMTYAVLARRHGATILTMDRKLTPVLRRMEVGCYCPLD